MSDTPQDVDAEPEEGGYGYPTLEQEVTPELLEAGAEVNGSGDSTRVGPESAEDGDGGGRGDGPTPGELENDPSAVEPSN